MKIYKLVIILVSFFVFSYCSAQEIQDTSDIYRLLETAKNLSSTNPDSAIVLYENAEIASKKIGNKQTMMQTAYDFAYFLFISGKNQKAKMMFEKTLTLANELNNEHYYYLSKTYIGTIYLIFANYNLAIEYSVEALSYFEKEKDFIYISGIYLNLTFSQIEQKDFDKAMEYAELSLEYSILANNKAYESKSYLNLGEIYLHLEDYENSIINYKKSLQIIKQNKLAAFPYSNIELNIANVYVKMQMLDSAEHYLKIVSKTELVPYTKAYLFLTYSQFYEKKKNYNKALEFVGKAERITDTVILSGIKRKVFSRFADLYALKGNYKTAYEYKLIYEQINDSIFSADKYRIQNELEIIYETTKKQNTIDKLSSEKEISDLKNQRTKYVLFSIVFVFIGIVVLGVLIFRQNKLKAKHKSTELEQKLLRTQMNPHFIFNSISAIQNYIMSNNPLDASSYLSDFAKLMRATLTNSTDDFISLQNEIETIENYLKLQHLRLSEKFDYEINISEDIDVEDYTVPPMLLQPFIENSIIHAFTNKSQTKGLISISYYLADNQLIMETKDNGVGIKNTKKINSQHISKATGITKQRIELLSKKNKKKINFEIIDNKPTGTIVRFVFPI